MAFDISLDRRPPPVEPAPANFEAFYDAKVDVIADALRLACSDSGIAAKATEEALTRSSQRWNHLAHHANPVGWAIHAGLAQADKPVRSESPDAMNRATGGYVRGLPLDLAFDTLPLLQRAALVTGYFLDWSDEFTAAGFEAPVSTVRTRRERAVAFLGHHLRLDEVEVIPVVRAHLVELSVRKQSVRPEMTAVRGRGRRRTARNRLAAVAALVLLIVAGASSFRSTDDAEVAAAPELVEAPGSSARWFGPVSDDRGAFVALNTSGSSRFVASRDGAEWVAAARWNSRAVDLRADVSSFQRTGGRYVAVIETSSRYDTFVPPYVATSDDLNDWHVRQVEVAEPQVVSGLRSRYDVVAAAAGGDHVLVALQGSDELDFRSFGIRPEEVCAESATLAQRDYFLCDGETITVSAPDGDGLAGTRYFRATGLGAFLEIDVPVETVARSLVGFDGGFAVVDANLGHVWVSSDGDQWQRATSSREANRFVLLEGSASSSPTDGALVIEPDASGWRSQVVLTSGLGAVGSIPLEVEPAGVWSEPDVASGPAGWALFVTTSRPWERVGNEPGWAVALDDWIVSRLPDADTITAQSTQTSTTLRLVAGSEWADSAADGTIVLVDPATGSDLVEITPQDIERARPTALDQERVKAQVFFSPDGVSWRSVWSSTEDAWSGAVAVGDSELLLSGTQLTGGPLTIPLDG